LADVGLRGEYTAAVLDLHKSLYVDYIDPQHFSGPELQKVISSSTLENAVTDWLQYLGVADSVRTTDKGKLGHELQVKTPGGSKSHDLTHAGVGLSQVLPILVSSLLAATDTTLVFEQPELHLHPRVQTRLADFFLSMALLGKQCVIETHSEYLINRLRLRIASSEINIPLSPMIKIYFVEKEGDSSTFREVIVNEYGAIPEWPDGFFDQSQDEAEHILRAATAKRRVLRPNSEDAKRNN
jgi:predicted ATPase